MPASCRVVPVPIEEIHRHEKRQEPGRNQDDERSRRAEIGLQILSDPTKGIHAVGGRKDLRAYLYRRG